MKKEIVQDLIEREYEQYHCRECILLQKRGGNLCAAHSRPLFDKQLNDTMNKFISENKKDVNRGK